jgi:two-component sensor histidine kinase
VSPRGKRAAQYVFGVVCAGAMIGLRSVFDVMASGSGPFALIYPTVLLATLYGRLRAGLIALALTFFWVWYYVLPAKSAMTLVNPADPARVALNAACAIIVVVFAEAFRRAAHSTVTQIQEAADRRLILLAEVEHRTKNNFALVASMLEFQRRRLEDPMLQAHLADAVGRVRTFADAYNSLAMDQDELSDVEMKPYLQLLLDRLDKAALPEHVRLYREIDPVTLPREIAVAIGLYLNESLSNCLKYAFPDGQKGSVGVYFHVKGSEWSLTVDDDGVGGHASPSEGQGGLGKNLMNAFAQQAGAVHASGPIPSGYRAAMTTALQPVAAF